MDLDFPKDSLGGSTTRAQYVRALENTKLSPKMRAQIEEDIKLPIVPDDCDLVWLVFWELFAGERLAYSEIVCYMHLHGVQLTTNDITNIREMDSVACAVVSDSIKSKSKKTPAKPKNKGTKDA